MCSKCSVDFILNLETEFPDWRLVVSDVQDAVNCYTYSFLSCRKLWLLLWLWGCSSVGREHRTGTPPTQVRFPGAATDFSPKVNFQCRLSYSVRTPPCAISWIYICAHVKDPAIHVKARRATETLKHQACTVVMVARLCRSWRSPVEATWIRYGRNPFGTIQL